MTYHFPDEGGQVGGHLAHLGAKILLQLLPILCQRDDPGGEALDIDQVNGGDIHACGVGKAHAHSLVTNRILRD